MQGNYPKWIIGCFPLQLPPALLLVSFCSSLQIPPNQPPVRLNIQYHNEPKHPPERVSKSLQRLKEGVQQPSLDSIPNPTDLCTAKLMKTCMWQPHSVTLGQQRWSAFSSWTSDPTTYVGQWGCPSLGVSSISLQRGRDFSKPSDRLSLGPLPGRGSHARPMGTDVRSHTWLKTIWGQAASLPRKCS